MLPFVGHQDRNLSGGEVQVVAREPGHAGDAAVIDGSDGFPLAVSEVEQEVQGLVREHGDRSVKSEDGASRPRPGFGSSRGPGGQAASSDGSAGLCQSWATPRLR